MNSDNNSLRCMECGGNIPNREPDYSWFIQTGLCRKCKGEAQDVRAILEDMADDIQIINHFSTKLAINLDRINNLLQ